jgi:tRNA dimethylallyltransferase
MTNYNCIVVLGPTASGKTHLACQLAYYLNGEIISADSRQVYKHLDIGTGKDLNEYSVNGEKTHHYLIDVIEPEEQFYLHDFVRELNIAFNKTIARDKIPIICGGTGLYLDAIRKDFSLTQIKKNETLRKQLIELSKPELQKKFETYHFKELTQVDLNSTKRLIRAIEIAEHLKQSNQKLIPTSLPYKPYYIGIKVSIEKRKELIYKRLEARINHGLINEVESLLQKGITHERLQFLGLEYKFVSNYLQAKISKDELLIQLSTAINQFSKRQMTWFRKMEREGVKINWIEKEGDLMALLKELKSLLSF